MTVNAGFVWTHNWLWWTVGSFALKVTLMETLWRCSMCLQYNWFITLLLNIFENINKFILGSILYLINLLVKDMYLYECITLDVCASARAHHKGAHSARITERVDVECGAISYSIFGSLTPIYSLPMYQDGQTKCKIKEHGINLDQMLRVFA